MRARLSLALMAPALVFLGRAVPADRGDTSWVVGVRFAPGPVPGFAVERGIRDATKSVRVMAYSFTDDDIAAALVGAKARGVDVKVMVDERRVGEKGSAVPMLLKGKVPVLTDGTHPVFHHKAVVIDGWRTFCGSYNFSAQAHRNAEDQLEVEGDSVAQAFLAEWDNHLEHAHLHPDP